MSAIQKQKKAFTLDFAGKRYVFPLRPEAYEVPWQTRASFTPTRDGGWEDNFGLHVGGTKLRIQGTFGVKPPGGGALLGPVQFVDGWESYLLLEGLFQEFYKAFSGARSSGGAGRIEFRDLATGHAFVVQINTFRALRNTQRRFLTQYTIEMTTLAFITDGERAPDILSSDPSDPRRPVQDAVLTIEAGRVQFVPTAAALASHAEVSSREVLALSAAASAVDGRHQDALVSALYFTSGASASIPMEISELDRTIRDTRALAGSLGGFYDRGEVPAESIVGLHAIQRGLQEMASLPDLFGGGGGFFL